MPSDFHYMFFSSNGKQVKMIIRTNPKHKISVFLFSIQYFLWTFLANDDEDFIRHCDLALAFNECNDHYTFFCCQNHTSLHLPAHIWVGFSPRDTVSIHCRVTNPRRTAAILLWALWTTPHTQRSGKKCRSTCATANKLCKSFFPEAVRLINTLMPANTHLD